MTLASGARRRTNQARATPNDLKLVDNVTATYERLGRPDEGLKFLRSLPRGANADAIDQRIGGLAERAGHADQALAAYRAVQARHPNNADAALRTAGVLYRAGDYRGSLAALKIARAGAKDSDQDFWRNYAELARLLRPQAKPLRTRPSAVCTRTRSWPQALCRPPRTVASILLRSTASTCRCPVFWAL